ncbi:MAG: GPW/gp25 family protein [Alphaproteobacteria bacterium]|nr:GPW/gp25 family protein [Alphaproteobacteria bacterium]
MNAFDGTTLTEQAHIAQSLQMLITTAPGERVMRPAYGCDLPSLQDAPINGDTILDMQQAIIEAVETHEPRASVNAVRITSTAQQLARGDITIEIDGNFGLTTITA